MKVIKPRSIDVDVPAGTYFLGDPCYAVPDKLWSEVCDQLWADGTGQGVAEVAGHSVLAFSTAFGDGSYADQDGREYPVDAGMIGLVPRELAAEASDDELNDLGQIVVFKGVTRACTDGQGQLRFGRYFIDTTDEGDDGDGDW